MRRLLSIPLLLAAVLALALVLGACGGDDDDDEGTETPGTSEEATPDGSEVSLDTPGPDSPTVSAASVTAATGGEVEAAVQVAGFGPPGLGAWTVDITYDPAVISIVECAAEPGSDAQGVCNPEYEDDVIRIAGAVAIGIEGDTTLALINVRCEAAGTSPLAIVLDVFADGTIGDPQPTAAHLEDGAVTCT